MRAVVVREHGGVEVLRHEARDVPEPGPFEVRVAIRAAGLNHLDTWVRRGVPGHQFPLPLVVGSDGSGVVDAIGPGVRTHAVGAEVLLVPGTSCGQCEACTNGHDPLCRDYHILGESRDGTCAEYVVLPARNALPKPANLDFEQAASFALVFQTSWSMLVDKARLQPGETVLVQAGGSGVGMAAVQIAKSFGATVIATAGTDAKCQRVLDLGADHAIQYTKEDFAKSVKQLTDRRGVDVVFEHVGGETFQRSVRCLKWGGRLVTCGATTGGKVEINLHELFFKNIALVGSTGGSLGSMPRILRLFESGRLRPVIDRVIGFDEIAQGHEALEGREVFGKIVVRVS
ncbi:MAG: zinc-binding dehydrogenase [Planctomycetes bacterium]|nr:zinc-binding dehydrogenase [Planctomycetota bacterium]